MPKVSIVIPVYNVEPYIERCLHSLFCQTLDDIEYLFVDDCSTDSSINKIHNILEIYPNRKSQVRILQHNINRGVGATRATGIRNATGDYIIHCDSDDYAECDMYEKLYERAIATQSDIVTCHYFVESVWGINTVCKKYDKTPQLCLENIYKKGRHCGSLCDKLVRKNLITQYDIIPYEGCNYAEDLYCVVKILYYAHSLTVVNQPLYHYCRRGDSLTASPKNEYYWNMRKANVDRICNFLSSEKKYKTVCHQMRFYVKMEYRSAFIGKEKEWFELYQESHDKIFKYDDMPLKGRILWWFALRNYFIYKVTKKMVRGM